MGFLLTIVSSGIYVALPWLVQVRAPLAPVTPNPDQNVPIAQGKSSSLPVDNLVPLPSVSSPATISRQISPEEKDGIQSTDGGRLTSSDSAPSEEALRMNNQAVVLAKKQQYSRSLHLLSEAHKNSPDSIETLINLGVVYTEFGLVDKGMTYFEKAYNIDPVEPSLLKNIAILDQAGLLQGTLITKESYEGLVVPVNDLNDAL